MNTLPSVWIVGREPEIYVFGHAESARTYLRTILEYEGWSETDIGRTINSFDNDDIMPLLVAISHNQYVSIRKCEVL